MVEETNAAIATLAADSVRLRSLFEHFNFSGRGPGRADDIDDVRLPGFVGQKRLSSTAGAGRSRREC